MTHDEMTVNELLITMRKYAGLSQKELAERSGISRKTISAWERDKTKDDILLSQLKAVAKACRVAVDFRFIYGEVLP